LPSPQLASVIQTISGSVQPASPSIVTVVPRISW
jgi:hypothetical protein